MEGRYRETANLVRDRLPGNAVLITVWESGSVRFHADREIVMWESLDPAWLDNALTWLRSKQMQPSYLCLSGVRSPNSARAFAGSRKSAASTGRRDSISIAR